MKCRKKKCAGSGVATPHTMQQLPVYKCTVCGREWAVGVLKKKRRPAVGTAIIQLEAK
jgi:hypothetical protein